MNKLVLLHQAMMVSLYKYIHISISIHVIAGHITYVDTEFTNHINYTAS